MIVATRVGIRMERSALRWSAALIVLIVAGLLLVAFVFGTAFASHQPCDADLRGDGCGNIGGVLAGWWGPQQMLIALLWAVPTGVGALLGVAITAAELERGSARISWSLSVSRRRWLLLRLIPVACILTLILGLAAGAAEVLTRARLVTDQPGFTDYQLRSVLVPLRGLLALTVGVACGAMIGRTLPALLVAILASAALTVGLGVLADLLHQGGATFMSLEELALRGNEYPLIVWNGTSTWPQGTGFMQIPVSSFPLWVALESALYASFVAGVAIVADGIVAKRSPR